MTPEQQKALALAQARRRRAEAEGGASVAPETEARNGPFEGFGQALTQSVDAPLEAMGTTAEMLGATGLGSALKGAVEQTPGYESASEKFINDPSGEGFGWSYLPKAVVEQAGQFAGSVASRVAGAGIGAAGGAVVAGPAGAAVGAAGGAIAGPATFEAAQQLGPVAQERARNNGRETPNAEDWAWAAGTAGTSGALNAVAPGATGILRRMGLEGATEAAQSAVQQTGETAGTEKGFDLSVREAIGEGILGAGSAGVVDSGIRGAQNAKSAVSEGLAGIRYDTGFDENDAGAVSAILNAADGDMSIIGDVRSTDPEDSAKGVVKAARANLRAEINSRMNTLRKLAKENGSQEQLDAVNTLSAMTAKETSRVPEVGVERLLSAFPGVREAQEIASQARQIRSVNRFAKGDEDLGGLGRLTRYLDPLDGRNSGLVRAGAVVANIPTVGAGIVTNRVARRIDAATNNRSRVKRYVDSVMREKPNLPDPDGRPVDAILGQMKADKAAKAQAEKAARVAQAKADKEAAKAPQGAAPLDQSNGSPAQARPTGSWNSDFLFEEGASVPQTDPLYSGYRAWQDRTGMNPQDTLDTLEQLAREGVVPQDVPRRYREDIGSFGQIKGAKKGFNEAVQYQEAVRQRANPTHQYKDHRKAPEAAPSADQVLAKLEGLVSKPTGSRRKEKAFEGARRRRIANARIDGMKGALTPDQFIGLHQIAETIDSPAMTREDRLSYLRQELPKLGLDVASQDILMKDLGSLAAIGNDYAITRTEEEQVKEEAFEEKVEKAKKTAEKKKPKKTKAAKPAETPAQEPEVVQPVPAPVQPKTPADRALEKLTKSQEEPVGYAGPEEPLSDAAKDQIAKVLQVPETKAKGSNRNNLREMVDKRIADRELSRRVAEGEGELIAYMADLPMNTRGRVEGLIYDFASDRLTQNMITDAFASRYNIPPAEAARIVDETLAGMEAEGLFKRISPRGSSALKEDGKYKKTPEGDRLEVVQLDFKSATDPQMIERVNVAKARNAVAKMVDQAGPAVEYRPGQIEEGAHKAFTDYTAQDVDHTFAPLLNFVNDLRSQRMSIHPRMLGQIEEALNVRDKDKQGVVNSVLRPVLDDGSRDDAPLGTVAQMIYMLGDGEGRQDTRFRQEWSAGANGRVYSKNSLAHTQSGDIMKGMTRLSERTKIGSPEALDFMFHSFGNLLGADKEAPSVRRGFVFSQPDMIDNLVKFAEAPFSKGRLNAATKGSPLTAIGKIVKDSEGFFQALNVGHELSNMVAFARERFPGKARRSAGALLQDPEVRADLAANYETDFIVQLDASNNAYQLAGMAMGYSDVLQATGMMPRSDGNPDDMKGADIYLEPAKSIASRIPEIDGLGLPDSKLRKIFKGPIGTYLYEAEFSSRKQAFIDQMEAIAEGGEVVGITGDPLIRVPQNVADALRGEGHTFLNTHYDLEGNIKAEKSVTKRVVQSGGKWKVVTGAAGEPKGRAFDSEEAAISAVFADDLYARMNRELVRDFNSRYPRMQEYLKFSNAVSKIIKERAADGGPETVTIPSPDGIALRHTFKDNNAYEAHPVQLATGKVVPLGYRSGDSKLAGRGVAAFMMHQLDAYVLRETHRRMKEEGLLQTGFNPIHDSFGFHPSEAQRGQEIWAEVMQELGDPSYNIFDQVMEANGISPRDIIEAGGTIPRREGVEPVPARRIPTALS